MTLSEWGHLAALLLIIGSYVVLAWAIYETWDDSGHVGAYE